VLSPVSLTTLTGYLAEEIEGRVSVAPIFKSLRRAHGGVQDPSNPYSREANFLNLRYKWCLSFIPESDVIPRNTNWACMETTLKLHMTYT